MAESESRIVAQNATAALASRVDAALRAANEPARPTLDDLRPLAAPHDGGRPASLGLAGRSGIDAGRAVLDVGPGLGAARGVAARFGGRVTGIDLTPVPIARAADLTRRTGLADRIGLVVGSALAIPFRDAGFARATLFPIQDKPGPAGAPRRTVALACAASWRRGAPRPGAAAQRSAAARAPCREGPTPVPRSDLTAAMAGAASRRSR